VTFDVLSTGKYGDTVVGVVSAVAKQALLVNGAGSPSTGSTSPAPPP